MNSGRTLFSQVMDFVPWTSFSRIVNRYQGNHRVRSLSCAEQFRAMTFAQLTFRQSLRDIESCLAAHSQKLYGMGFRSKIRRSTLADANEKRSWQIWSSIAENLIRRARRLYANDPFAVDLSSTVYALDSSLINLCLSLSPWAPAPRQKGGVKLHTLLDLRGPIPAKVQVGSVLVQDFDFLDQLVLEPGAFYLMDRGYTDFARLFRVHQSGAFFIIRAKSHINMKRLYSNPVEKVTGVQCDQVVQLSVYKSAHRYPEQLRRIRFLDAERDKRLVFLTNNFLLPSPVICSLYKQRWQVELFFKWIKQHLSIKHFFGNSENAVKTQIWCAIAAYVLIAIIRKELHLESSLYKMLQVLSVSIFEKAKLGSAFADFDYTNSLHGDPNQLKLFEF